MTDPHARWDCTGIPIAQRQHSCGVAPCAPSGRKRADLIVRTIRKLRRELRQHARDILTLREANVIATNLLQLADCWTFSNGRTFDVEALRSVALQ